MRFNRHGDLAGGSLAGGQVDLWVWPAGTPEPRLLGVRGGQGQWLTDELLVAFDHQRGSVGLWRRSQGFARSTDLWPSDGSFLGAGGGNWLMTAIPPSGPITVGDIHGVPVRDSRDRLLSMGPDGTYAVAAPNGSQSAHWGGGLVSALPHDAVFVTACRGSVIYRRASTAKIEVLTVDGKLSIETVGDSQWPGIAFPAFGQVWLWYEISGGHVLHPASDARLGYRFSGPMHGRDVFVFSDGSRRVDLAWATGQGEAVGFIARQTLTLGDGMVALTPRPQPEPDPQPPDPPDPPEPEPMPTPNRIDIVRATVDAHRDLADRNTHEDAGRLTEYIAWALAQADPGWGHLSKPEGQNRYNGHAVDAVIYRPTQQVIDVLKGAGDGPDEPTSATWQEVPKRDNNHWMPAFKPDDADEPPPDPPPVDPPPAADLSALLQRLDAIAADVTALRTEQAHTRQQLVAVLDAVKQIAIPPPGQPGAAPSYSGTAIVKGRFHYGDVGLEIRLNPVQS